MWFRAVLGRPVRVSIDVERRGRGDADRPCEYVNDIKIASTKEVTGSVVADLNKEFHTKHLGEIT